MRIKVRGVPTGAICALWAADPFSAPRLSDSYHTHGKTERMPSAATFENFAVARADDRGRVRVCLAHPLHGYASSLEGYSEPAHVHMRWWDRGITSPTFSYAMGPLRGCRKGASGVAPNSN